MINSKLPFHLKKNTLPQKEYLEKYSQSNNPRLLKPAEPINRVKLAKIILNKGRIPKKPDFVISTEGEILKRQDFSHSLEMT